MIRKYLYFLAATGLLAACNSKMETTEEGVSYKIITTDANERTVAKGDMLQLHMVGKAESSDSVVFDSYKNNKPFYIPAEEPTLKSLFALLHKGDSVFFKVAADTLYLKSFGAARPPFIKEGEQLLFTLKLINVYNQEELQAEIQRQNQALISKDEAERAEFVQAMGETKKTDSGLAFKTITPGKGKQPKKGDKVQVKYKGMLLNGTVFDESKEGQPDFTFNLGLGQVIQGWDEILGLMKEGEELQVVIPWNLAYGERGSGPIPPFSTLVFNIQLIKVN